MRFDEPSGRTRGLPRRRGLLAAPSLALLLFLLVVRGASAAPPPAEEARRLTPVEAEAVTELTKEAQELRRAGEFAEAARKLEEAIAIYPAPVLFYNLGRTYEDLGRLEDAARAYERCLSGKPPADVRAKARKALADVHARGRHGTLVLAEDVPADAEVVVDGVRRVRGPLPLSPGTHRVEVRREGFQPYVETVQVTGGATVTIEPAWQAAAPERPDRPAEPQKPERAPEPEAVAPEPGEPEEPSPPADEDRHRLFRLGLTLSEGVMMFDGEPFRGKVGLELLPSLDFRWWKVDLGLALVLEPPVAFVLRPGVRFAVSVFYVRPAFQFLLSPITTTGMLFGLGAEIPLGRGWALMTEFDVSVWFQALGVVPLDGRLGVSYGF